MRPCPPPQCGSRRSVCMMVACLHFVDLGFIQKLKHSTEHQGPLLDLVALTKLMCPCAVLENLPCALFSHHNRKTLLLIISALSFCRTECISKKKKENFAAAHIHTHTHIWLSFTDEILTWKCSNFVIHTTYKTDPKPSLNKQLSQNHSKSLSYSTTAYIPATQIFL